MVYAKIFGWVLIIAGIAIIVWTLVASYNFFTGKNAVFEVFHAPVIIGNAQSNDFQAQLNEQLAKMIPTDAIVKTLNLAVWSVLAFILIFGGSQIANIGIKLINRQ